MMSKGFLCIVIETIGYQQLFYIYFHQNYLISFGFLWIFIGTVSFL